jgi:hypothetical protein
MARIVAVTSLRPLIPIAAAAALLAGCGSSGSSGSSDNSGGSSGGGSSSSSLTAQVKNAKGEVQGNKVVASSDVKVGGKPGTHLTLKWNLVDAVSGVRASEEDEIAKRFVTTADVKDETVNVTSKLPVPTDYIVHFALYAPDGSYLSSADSKVFTVH